MCKNPPLTIAEWSKLQRAHLEIVSPVADSFLKRRSLGIKHPVEDFLFTYYTFSPTKLKMWVPKLGDVLKIDSAGLQTNPHFASEYFLHEEDAIRLNEEKIGESARGLAKFVEDLSTSILHRPARFGCFGLHEWAMVYKANPDTIRHQGYKLRLPVETIAAFVESQSLQCTHYDAYRFFTPQARPLNSMNPTIDSRIQMEQGGCVHANMDLYKWAYKLWPWIGSELICRAFVLAKFARELDMRASPYALGDVGLLPIAIETETGRREYQKKQAALSQKATMLRLEILNFCKQLLLAGN